MGVGVENIEQVCLECGQRCNGRRSIGNHVARSHKHLGGLRGYVIKHITFGEKQLCKCGCGKEVEWHKLVYRFNDYISGHNYRFSSTNQPKFTKEQSAYRISKIRETYKNDRGQKIKQKISKSTKKSHARPEVKAKLIAAQTAKWADPEYKARTTETRRRVWREQRDDLLKKIFTPEMRAKISKANMQRDQKRISKWESEFAEHLRSCGFVVEQSKWFNFAERHWCADVWLPDHRVIVECDGSYYHGLDRDEGYTEQQLINMERDLWKNERAIEKKMNLARIDERSEWQNIKSIDDLFSMSYFLILNGELI